MQHFQRHPQISLPSPELSRLLNGGTKLKYAGPTEPLLLVFLRASLVEGVAKWGHALTLASMSDCT